MKERAKEMLIGENMKLILINLHQLFVPEGFFAIIIDPSSTINRANITPLVTL